jgi:hypothetical protein
MRGGFGICSGESEGEGEGEGEGKAQDDSMVVDE